MSNQRDGGEGGTEATEDTMVRTEAGPSEDNESSRYWDGFRCNATDGTRRRVI